MTTKHSVYEPPNHSNLFTPYSILAYTLVMRCASARLKMRSQLRVFCISGPKTYLTMSSSAMKSSPCAPPASTHACRIVSTIMSAACLQFLAPASSSAGSMKLPVSRRVRVGSMGSILNATNDESPSATGTAAFDNRDDNVGLRWGAGALARLDRRGDGGGRSGTNGEDRSRLLRIE